MTIISQPFYGEKNLPLLTSLLAQVPATSLHLIDLPWRLSNPTIPEGENARLFLLSDGTVVGFAAWQIYWAMLDYFVLPGEHQAEVETALFAWARERFRQLDAERGYPLPYWVAVREDNIARSSSIEQFGFTRDEDYHYMQLQHDLTVIASEPLPAGFRIRPLAGTNEINTYVALHRAAFESNSMTHDWRARTLQHPQYKPELDLIAVAPDGSPAGFCVGWFHQHHRIGQVEPLGIHPAYHRQGLGRALLLTLLQQFKQLNASYVIVEPENTRLAAVKSYQGVGFQPAHRLLLKGQTVTE